MEPRPRLVRASIARGIIDDDSVRVTVVDAEKNKVEYNGETTALSPLAEKLRNVSAIQGASVFTYKGKKITDIAEETQWRKEDTSSETETDEHITLPGRAARITEKTPKASFLFFFSHVV